MCFLQNGISYFLLYIIYGIWISYRVTVQAIDYKIKKILPYDKPKINAFLNNAFYPHDPELKAMNITEVHSSHNEYVLGIIDEGYSHAAVEKDGTTLAVLLMGSGFINRYSSTDLEKAAENCQSEYFRRLLQFYQAMLKIGGLMNIANSNNSMHFSIAATLPRARRQGIMRRLFQHGTELARRKGFKLVTCAGASQFIANLCESLKWRCISSLALKNIEDHNDNALFQTNVHPHENTQIYVQNL